VTGTDAMGRIVSDDYDLLIMDMRLPDMTGPQLYDQVAELRPEMLRRLVFMTAGPVPPETESFLRRTGAPCLVKPFEVDRALRVMDTILQAD
jgi:DNA-binding NtrC family response regulator